VRWPEIDKRATRTIPRQFFSDFEIPPPTRQSMSETEKLPSDTGILKFFLKDSSVKETGGKGSGYGFLSREGKPDVFLHINSLKASGFTEAPPAGTKLSFDLEPVPNKQPQAVNIKIIP
jgi:cold shock CspA family protein